MLHQLVLFDMGGVAVEVESDRLMHQFAQLLGRSFDEVQEAVYDKELLLPFELGRISARSYYEGLKEKLSLPLTYERFVESWNSIFRENTEVTRLMHRLHKYHKLVALTNTNELHLGYLRTMIPSLAVLDGWVASCEVGLRKPDPSVYRLALSRFRVPPDRTVYIDDRPELVDAGRSVGLTAIRFESSDQLNQDLQAIGLNL